jgi:hypothetical protein
MTCLLIPLRALQLVISSYPTREYPFFDFLPSLVFSVPKSLTEYQLHTFQIRLPNALSEKRICSSTEELGNDSPAGTSIGMPQPSTSGLNVER